MSERLNEKPNAAPLPTLGNAGVMLNGRYLPPPEDKDGKIWIRTSSRVEAEAEDLYAIWRDVEAAPLWQEQITRVTTTGKATSHWVMQSGDKTIEWDSEVLTDEPGHRIAWRSIGGESDNAGEVVFEPAPGGRGTMVTVLQEFRMGKLAASWETFVAQSETGRHRKSPSFQSLRRDGEIPRTQGQPHGPRGPDRGNQEIHVWRRDHHSARIKPQGKLKQV